MRRGNASSRDFRWLLASLALALARVICDESLPFGFV